MIAQPSDAYYLAYESASLVAAVESFAFAGALVASAIDWIMTIEPCLPQFLVKKVHATPLLVHSFYIEVSQLSYWQHTCH